MIDDETELIPSRVRALILDEHERLRRRMLELRELVTRPRRELRPASRAFLEALGAHLDLEDRILAPTLETIDAWGPERRARLDREHAAQRSTFARLMVTLADDATSLEAIAAKVGALLDDLERDMATEETDCLDPDLLREEPIRTDFGG